jgi:hypothetical protein
MAVRPKIGTTTLTTSATQRLERSEARMPNPRRMTATVPGSGVE